MELQRAALDDALTQLRQSEAHRESSLEETMRAVTDSVLSIFDVTGAGLMLLDDDQLLRSALATDDVGWELEQAQERLGEGPCVDSLVYGCVLSTEDLRSDPRWPSLHDMATSRGVGGVLGIPVCLSGATIGTLNIYSSEPRSWDGSEQHGLVTYGSLLESVLAAALLAERRDRIVHQLQQALESRVVIERCVGLIMGRDGVDAVEAFNRLRTVARSTRRRVAAVATELLAEAESSSVAGA